MAYSYVSKKSNRNYFLHKRQVTLKNGISQTIYFFAPSEREGTIDEIPAGFEVGENPRTGLPYLKRSK